jgi:hypothetical protein
LLPHRTQDQFGNVVGHPGSSVAANCIGSSEVHLAVIAGHQSGLLPFLRFPEVWAGSSRRREHRRTFPSFPDGVPA